MSNSQVAFIAKNRAPAQALLKLLKEENGAARIRTPAGRSRTTNHTKLDYSPTRREEWSLFLNFS